MDVVMADVDESSSSCRSLSADPHGDERWRDVRRFTDRPSQLAPSYFEPGPQNFCYIEQTKVLVIGAGGLGCELLKNLALTGFKHIEVIDMDTIDLSNLNRQFLFRESDVGKSKAKVAANFINSRVDGCHVIAHDCKIQEKPMSFYQDFHIVVCGLDSVPARRWLNHMLCDIARINDDGEPEGVIPLIDGGTEGFKGNARVILPKMTACIECTLDLYPPQVNFPLCTIAHTPRLPEHCVEYVKVIEWDKLKPFGDEALDADNPEHVSWVLDKASFRANQYGIRGVDRRLTQGVLKRIIPAVASTNAVIAASCALEAFKMASNVAFPISNYLNFTDISGVYLGVVKMERNPQCLACGVESATVSVSPSATLSHLYNLLVEKYQLRNPSLRTSEGPLYEISDFFPQLKEQSNANLAKSLTELGVRDGTELLVADEVLRQSITLTVKLEA